MEIIVDDEQVVADLGEDLARPRRLSAAEGFALAAAAQAILATSGVRSGHDEAGALERALAKLEAALGAGVRPAGDTDGGLRVDLGDAPRLADLRRAVHEGRQLAVRYYSLSSDEESERVIDPLALVTVEGRWYLDAYCHRAGGMRRFRVDRLVAVGETGRFVDHGAEELPSADEPAFVPGPDATVATVAVAPAGMWLVEAVPTLRVCARDDGRTEVDLAVASPVWFERLLLRLGPHAEVLGPPELVTVGRQAAARLLARYASVGEPGS
jgi:proteasome accessory factor C